MVWIALVICCIGCGVIIADLKAQVSSLSGEVLNIDKRLVDVTEKFNATLRHIDKEVHRQVTDKRLEMLEK